MHSGVPAGQAPPCMTSHLQGLGITIHFKIHLFASPYSTATTGINYLDYDHVFTFFQYARLNCIFPGQVIPVDCFTNPDSIHKCQITVVNGTQT